MKNRHKKSLAATSLALVISASGAVTSLALPQAAPDQEFTEAYQRLYDNQMDYDELEDLVKNFYPPIKNTYDTYYNTYEEEQAGIVNSMFEAAREMDDAADDLEDAIKSGALSAADAMGDLMVAKATAKGYRSGAQSMGYNIELGIREDNKNLKQIQRGVNKIVYSLQQAMNGYEQIMLNRDVAAKGVEIAETARNIQQTMQAQGLAIDADVISAASGLTSARSQLAALDTQAESIKKTLCTFTGWGSDGNPVIGAVPTSDVAAIAAIDVNADKEKAVNNNYSLISMRGAKGGGMDQIEQIISKNTTQTKNKVRNVAYSEDLVRSNIQTLYDTILEKKVEYDSATTAWQAAQNTWQAAQIQYRTGSLSQIGYMQQELAYLQARAAYRSADLNLQQAMQNYTWAVKGLDVSAS